MRNRLLNICKPVEDCGNKLRKKRKQLKKVKWFHQTKNFGLGNFVTATPALKLLGTVNVYFESPGVKSLYVNCKFIKILRHKPRIKPIGSSKPLGELRQPNESDSDAYCRVLAGRASKIPNTYVDGDITKVLKKHRNKKYVAIFHGCLSVRPRFIKSKNIGRRIRQQIIESILAHGMVPVLLGNKHDYNKFWSKNNTEHCVNYIGKLSLKDSVSILQQCDCFVSNDTGLYHVAGALQKPGLVMWRLTNSIKNRSTFDGIQHFVNKKLDADQSNVILNKFLKKHECNIS